MNTNPIALITGASSGFGAITASLFAAQGFRVFGTSRSGASTAQVPEMLALDVDRDDSVRACVDELLRRAGRIDVVVNNAGRAMVGACEETQASEARALFETNVFGVMRVVTAMLPHMRQQRSGRIINVGSLSGFVGVPFHGVYAATKHALAGYSEALRFEVEQFRVSVSLIEPEAHRTNIQMCRPTQLMSLYDSGRDRVESIIRAQIESGAAPERVAKAILCAATAKRPAFRYRVGGKASFAAVGRRLLPDAIFDRVVRREFPVANGQGRSDPKSSTKST